jgi:hypothetical protein
MVPRQMPELHSTPCSKSSGARDGRGGGSRIAHQPNAIRGWDLAIAIPSPTYSRRLAARPIVHSGGLGVR